jgi:hypothetical protein
MSHEFSVQPLPYRERRRTFLLLLTLFIVSLPFLYLYATGYRFDLNTLGKNIVSTGGMYIAVERTGAEIYIDGELVRETRVFRRAFYAQNIDPGTHRVHVQKEGHHTWVKELPVTPHLVTEAQAFNLPLVPQVRVIAPWQTATGSAVVREPLLHASTTNEVVATTTKATSTLTRSAEYDTLVRLFASSTPTTTPTAVENVTKRIESLIEAPQATTSTTTETTATSTIEKGGVRLYRDGEEVYAAWVGSFEQMPYYYCADAFPPYSTSTPTSTRESARISDASVARGLDAIAEDVAVREEGYMHPVQTVSPDAVCDPKIRIDRKWQQVRAFDFVPNSSDFIIMGLEGGIYVVEVDDRSWQNMQPIMEGDELDFRVENGVVYIFNGELIYQMRLEL